MKIVPKAQYGRPLVAQSDNTRVFTPWVREQKYKPKKKRIVQPIITAPNTPRQLQEEYNKQGRTVWKNIKKQQDQEKAAKIADGFLTFISPSTYIGPAFNSGKSYSQSLKEGTGSGDQLLNAAIDMFTPVPLFALKRITLGTKIPLRSVKGQNFKQSPLSLKSSPTEDKFLRQKRLFVEDMDNNELAFKNLEDKEQFITNVDYPATLIPKKGSELEGYMDWMDKTFGVKTLREIHASSPRIFSRGERGRYSPWTGEALLNPIYKGSKSTTIHEAASHGTDAQVANKVIKQYPFKLGPIKSLQAWATMDLRHTFTNLFKPTVQRIYSNISTISPSLSNTIKYRTSHRQFNLSRGINHNPQSSQWQEARATLNQVRHNILSNTNFNGKLNQEYLEKAVDEMPDNDILRMIEDQNGYGEDYINTYKLLSPEKQKDWMERVRHALKYLPATTPFIFPAIQNKNNR